MTPIPWELEVNDRDTLVILDDDFFGSNDEEDDEEEEEEEQTNLADSITNDLWVFTSGLFGLSFIMKDLPLAINMLTTTL